MPTPGPKRTKTRTSSRRTGGAVLRRRSVLMVGSEAVPFAKTGGLADVLGALPQALGRLGWDVTVALPRYQGVTAGDLVDRFDVQIGGFTASVGFHVSPIANGVRALLIDVPALYDRDGLYGVGDADHPDNARRFGMLARATLEFAARQSLRPTVIHAHDWQAGLVPVYLKTMYAAHPVLAGTPSVFTIHNVAFQGVFEADWLPRLDLPWSLLSVDRLEYWGRVSFLKGGINDAEMVTTVSPTYAEEIQTPAYGFGFDGILRRRSADLVGVLNGIDVAAWNPATDAYLPAPFDADDLSAKAASKREVLRRFGLPIDEAAMARPLVGMISRMVWQKGLDLIAALSSDLPALDAMFVVLGTGEPRYQDFWRNLATAYPSRIGVRIGFDEALAHLIEAGADILLMPSRFEPCGLNQMYSLRYGTVPVVRAVGGLADTVRDATLEPGDAATGFTFRDPSPPALLDALQRALAAFLDRPRWRSLQRAGMKEDLSWDRSAREYVRIYERATKAARVVTRTTGHDG